MPLAKLRKSRKVGSGRFSLKVFVLKVRSVSSCPASEFVWLFSSVNIPAPKSSEQDTLGEQQIWDDSTFLQQVSFPLWILSIKLQKCVFLQKFLILD